MPINIWKNWKAKLESAYSFMLKYFKITVCFERNEDCATVFLFKMHGLYQYRQYVYNMTVPCKMYKRKKCRKTELSLSGKALDSNSGHERDLYKSQEVNT